MRLPTAVASERPALRVEGYETIAEALDDAARTPLGFAFHSVKGEEVATLPYRVLRARAVDLARGLIQSGLPRGARVALMAETGPDFMVFFFACQYAGLMPVPLPLPLNLGGQEAYEDRLARQLRSAGPMAGVASADLLSSLRKAAEGLDIPLLGTPEDFLGLPGGKVSLRPFGKDDGCYIQYSSGSTRSPQGVTVTQRSLLANALGMIEGLAARPGDRCVSWLPLYHDMGLVGFCLGPIVAQLPVDYLAPQDFARRPLLWLDLISRNGGTISFSPTFGYDICVKRSAKAGAMGLGLSHWRVAGIGGDMIQPHVMRGFADAFAPAGFRPSALLPSYGLAESTLAVSFAPVGKGLTVDRVDREQIAVNQRAVPVIGPRDSAEVQEFVACGSALEGHTIEVRGEDGAVLPDRVVGRVFVQGPSVMAGYFNAPELTAHVLSADGWLDTGDLGYTIKGALVPTGRCKDLIISNGRNIWPQDIEWAVDQLPGRHRGDSAAFSVVGADAVETVVVVAESRSSDVAVRRELQREIKATVRRAVGAECHVVLAPPRSLPHTSSGKLSRSASKREFEAGAYSDPSTEPLAEEAVAHA